MIDDLEIIRWQRLVEINTDPARREALEARYGRVWDTDELKAEFVVLGFRAPFVVVQRKSDGRKRAWSSNTTRVFISAAYLTKREIANRARVVPGTDATLALGRLPTQACDPLDHSMEDTVRRHTEKEPSTYEHQDRSTMRS